MNKTGWKVVAGFWGLVLSLLLVAFVIKCIMKYDPRLGYAILFIGVSYKLYKWGKEAE